jgi:hypothetical protein
MMQQPHVLLKIVKEYQPNKQLHPNHSMGLELVGKKNKPAAAQKSGVSN